jgi:hypothetical protein
VGAGGAAAVGSVAGRVEVAGGVAGAEVSAAGWLGPTGAGVDTTGAGAVAEGVEVSGDATGVGLVGTFVAGVVAEDSGVEAAARGADFALIVRLDTALFG